MPITVNRGMALCAGVVLMLPGALVGCAEPPVAPALYACAPQVDPGAAHPRAARRQAIVDEYVRRGYPSLVLLVRDGDGLWIGEGGAADLASGAPRRACQLLNAASITKTFVAATALSLADEGRLDLDAPARTLLPADGVREVGNADGATVRQLLGNTSGVPSYNNSLAYLTDVVAEPRRAIPPYAYLDYVRGAPGLFPPGAQHHYSNSNYLLAGMVLDAIEGRDHAGLVRERVIARIGLDRTSYDRERPKPPELVRGYAELRGDGRVVDVTDFDFTQQYGSPAGGLHATVVDLQRFIEALLRERTLLSAASLEAMQTWVDLPPGVHTSYHRYGLGLEYVRTDRGYFVGHTGDKLGAVSFMLYEPTRDVTVVAMASAGADSPRFAALTQEFEAELRRLPYE